MIYRTNNISGEIYTEGSYFLYYNKKIIFLYMTGIIEVKAPYSALDMSLEAYMESGKCGYLKINDSLLGYTLNDNHNCYY